MTITVFVPELPEFQPLVQCARVIPACVVHPTKFGYWKIQAPRELRFVRKDLGLGPALWNSALSGGYVGRVVSFDRNEMHLVSEEATRA